MSEKGSSPAPVGPHVSKEPAGAGVPFPGREQETKLTFILAAKPSFIGFSFGSPAMKKLRCLRRDVVSWESSLGLRASVGVCNTRTCLCCGNLGSVEAPPMGSTGTFVHNRLRTLHVPLALFLTRVG